MTAPLRPSTLWVDLGAIRRNTRRLSELVAPATVCAVVKADGYGHGAVAVARAALEGGASWLAVALVEEAEELRAAGIDAPILLLSEPPPEGAERVVRAGVTATVYSPAFGDALEQAARQHRRRLPIHLKLDTGMHRVGVPPDRLDDLLGALPGWSHLEVEGVWTHLARADEPDHPTTRRQLELFETLLDRLRHHGIEPALVHAANSAAALTEPRSRYDLVRVGIAIYGLAPSSAVPVRPVGLEPALELVTRVGYVKRVRAGAGVSYGHTFTAPRDGWVATLPIGYADGVPRRLSNRAEVIVAGGRYPVAGTVCMDQLMVWLGDTEVDPGAEVVLIGRRGDVEVTVEEWATWADTVTYEIATGLGRRLPRRWTEGR